MRNLITISLLLFAMAIPGTAQEAPRAGAAGAGTPAKPGMTAKPAASHAVAGRSVEQSARAGHSGGKRCEHRACKDYCKEHCNTPCEEHCGSDCPEQCREYCGGHCRTCDREAGGEQCGPPWVKDMTPDERRAEFEKLHDMTPDQRQAYAEQRTQAWLQTLTPEQQAKFGAEQSARRAKFEAMTPEERAKLEAEREARRARFEAMSPAEREAMRAKFRNSGGPR